MRGRRRESVMQILREAQHEETRSAPASSGRDTIAVCTDKSSDQRSRIAFFSVEGRSFKVS
jgi:hypothetical protein